MPLTPWFTVTELPPSTMTQISPAPAPEPPPGQPPKPRKNPLASRAKGDSQNSNTVIVSGSSIPTIVTVLIANTSIIAISAMKHLTGRLHAPTSNLPFGSSSYFVYVTSIRSNNLNLVQAVLPRNICGASYLPIAPLFRSQLTKSFLSP